MHRFTQRLVKYLKIDGMYKEIDIKYFELNEVCTQQKLIEYVQTPPKLTQHTQKLLERNKIKR